MPRTDFNQLLEAGVHFGHLKRKWNPKMAPYIFMEKNGIHIIDLHKTVVKLDEAASALKQIAKSGRKVLFVATKKQAKDIVAEKVSTVAMPYVTERWPGGMLTNFPTIRKAVKKMATIDKLTNEGTFDNFSKREKLQIARQRAKLEKKIHQTRKKKHLLSSNIVNLLSLYLINNYYYMHQYHYMKLWLMYIVDLYLLLIYLIRWQVPHSLSIGTFSLRLYSFLYYLLLLHFDLIFQRLRC